MSELSTIPSGCDPVAAQRWAERLARGAQSGLSATAFCEAEHITKSNFFRWKRKLARPQATHRTRTTKAKPAKTVVVPIHVAPPPTPATPIELTLLSGNVVRFPADARPELIVSVLRGLEGRPC